MAGTAEKVSYRSTDRRLHNPPHSNSNNEASSQQADDEDDHGGRPPLVDSCITNYDTASRAEWYEPHLHISNLISHLTENLQLRYNTS